jgi:hypothetical protein
MYLGLHNEELWEVYFSLNFIQVTKSRKIGWSRHVARMGKRGVLVRRPEGKTTWKI